MLNFFKKLKNKFTLQSPPILDGLKNKKILNEAIYYNISFGNLNKDKYFYLIRRSPGTGLFSNVTFILNHIRICEKLGFIPIIDMENFKTIYNEKKKIKNTMNAWNYYFEPLNNYTLEDVYKSKNVLMTNDQFYHFFDYHIDKKIDLTKILKEKIKIKKNLKNIFLKISKKFDNKNTLGIHFRGTSYKKTPGHPLPANKEQMLDITKKIIKKNKIDLIFLVTEEKNYLRFFQDHFPDKLFFLKSSFRSNKNDAFKIYPRNLHRYKLGREALLETLLLSKCNHFIYLRSNISAAAISFNLNKNQRRYELKNGINSKNIFISQFFWYLKNLLPSQLGGFKKFNL